ncbi:MULTISPECIES: DUF4345 family protein [Kordiimonas]|uniref:DUF4345 domain-containing protein n=1 Tax=Kordiimonas lacus TaxID=637679 RepID=A0A1G7DPB0_9PROT|nr:MULTISPECIES: DUF4345 family protein [Kordiimonas]SDE53337.1 protein of unknown function [Kordiimonas lacus]
MSIQLVLVALVWAAIGIYGIVAPKKLYALFGVPVETADGRNEIRAVYGGMCLAVAVVMFEAPWLGAAAPGVLLTVMVMLAGMALGRIVSMVIERPGIIPVVFLGTEILGVGLLYSIIDMSALTAA